MNNLGIHYVEQGMRLEVNRDYLKYRRSYHYLTEMKKGDLVDLNKLTLVRPGDGISDNDLDKVCGKPLIVNVKAFDPCLISDIE